jgi:hypothetical protein
MFELAIKGSPVADRVEISFAGDSEVVFARCVFLSFSKRWSFSGLQVSGSDDSPVVDRVTVSQLQVVTLSIKSLQWSDIQKWIGWTDENGAVILLCKEITNVGFERCKLGHFLDFDLKCVEMDSGIRSIDVAINIEECSTIRQLADLLSRESISEQFG